MQKMMERDNLVHLELKKSGQYILPFSRRVISVEPPALIKETTSSMINAGKRSHADCGQDSQQKKTMDNVGYLYIVDKRLDTKFDDKICPHLAQNYGASSMSDRSIGHRLYDEYYGDEYDDDNDSIVESERQIHDFFVAVTKSRWAQYGRSMPEDFINPFEIDDDDDE